MIRTESPCIFLIFGAKGWIGDQLYHMLQAEGQIVYAANSRLENRESVMAELEMHQPTHVLNCAGVVSLLRGVICATGRPNVDWCEDNKQQTIRSNVIGTLNLADCCFLKKIHLTNFATGCIYAYDEAHPQKSGATYTEEDKPNFFGSYYSSTKAVVDQIIRSYDNVLTLRLRMPVSDDLHPRNFVTKIIKYERVVDVPNSMSVLHDLLPAALRLAKQNVTGVFNFTNPGAISHNEVLQLYKQYIDPKFTWKNFTLAEEAKVNKAGRSNCELDATKLVNVCREMGVEIPEIHAAFEQCFARMAVNLSAQ